MSQITQQIAQTIIEEYIAGASSYELADKYNLWQTSICNLIRGQTWKNCKRPDNIKNIIQARRKKGLDVGRECKNLPILSTLQEDIIVGSLLGDGGLNSGFNASFSKKQKCTRKEYLEWHVKMLGEYSTKLYKIYSTEKLTQNSEGKIKRTKVDKHLAAFAYETCRHPNLTKLRSVWYKNQKKIIPFDLKLNPQRIAIWYFDDGSNCLEQRQAVLCTQSFTFDEVEFLSEKLKAFNLHPRIAKVKSNYTGLNMPILKFGKSSYDNLISLVSPFMLWNCFSYKIEWRKAKEQWEYSGKFTKEQIKEIIEIRKIISAKEIAKIYNVHVNTIYSIVSGRSWKCKDVKK